MAAEETPPYGRSSSRAPRVVQDSSLEQRSFFGHKSSTKSHQKAVSDKLVWFSPVHSPLLSPAREKTLQLSKKKVRNSSIFSMQSRAKGSIEAEEPTSPKVSCIGQVRAYKKDKDPFADTSKKKIPTSKPGSMSPARFFASPGRTGKWGSLFGSRKDSCATPSSSGYSGDYVPERQDSWAGVNGYFDRYTHDAADSHVFGETRTFAAAHHNISRNEELAAVENSNDLDRHVKHKDSAKATIHVEPNDTDMHALPEKSFQGLRCNEKPPASKQRLTYEELPSLHCGASIKPNMKISVEVVPETWLLGDGKRSRPDSTSQINCVPERSSSISREDLQKARLEEMSTPLSPCGKAQPYTREGEGCVGTPVSLCGKAQPYTRETEGCIDYRRPQTAHVQDKSDFTPVDTDLVSVDKTTSKPLHVDTDRERDTQNSHADEASATVLSCTITDACKEESKGLRSSGDEDGAHGPQLDVHQAFHGKKLEGEEKHRILLGSSERKSRHRRLKRGGPDIGKENYSVTLPQLFDKKLPSINSADDGKHVWSVFKGGRKNDAFSAHPFSALILVGYDQSVASKDGAVKGAHEEELLKGIFEVGRLSFHGSGKYIQVLKGDAEFIRSRSATSYRTVITLPRCNSDPCRPSY